MEFHEFMNQLNDAVKFTLVWSKEKFFFLDILVSIHDSRLITELFQKPTDKNTLLHYSSSHPRAMVQSLPFSQFLRAKRIVSKKEKWLETAAKMTNDFRDRGYPSSLIQKQFDRVNDMDTKII